MPSKLTYFSSQILQDSEHWFHSKLLLWSVVKTIGFNNGLGTFVTGLLELNEEFESLWCGVDDFATLVMEIFFSPLTFNTSFSGLLHDYNNIGVAALNDVYTNEFVFLLHQMERRRYKLDTNVVSKWSLGFRKNRNSHQN